MDGGRGDEYRQEDGIPMATMSRQGRTGGVSSRPSTLRLLATLRVARTHRPRTSKLRRVRVFRQVTRDDGHPQAGGGERVGRRHAQDWWSAALCHLGHSLPAPRTTTSKGDLCCCCAIVLLGDDAMGNQAAASSRRCGISTCRPLPPTHSWLEWATARSDNRRPLDSACPIRRAHLICRRQRCSSHAAARTSFPPPTHYRYSHCMSGATNE